MAGRSAKRNCIAIRLIHRLQAHFVADPSVYVSGNLLVYYERGNIPKRVSPDVFVVRGVPKRMRDHFLLWEEGLGPQVVIELTSASTRREDQNYKFKLYRDVLNVQEYFVFDPWQEYLTPPLQGYRLDAGSYRPIVAIEGRLPSVELEVSLEADGEDLKILNPVTSEYLLCPLEAAQADLEAARVETEALQAEAANWRAIAEATCRDTQQLLELMNSEQRESAEKEIARLRGLL